MNEKIICPNHEGAYDCTPFCELCEGEQEYTPASTTTAEVVDPCVYCGESTAFGYGKFVNRLSVDDGWGCAECSGFNCDICDTQIPVDADVTDKYEDGHYHQHCLPLYEHYPDDGECGCETHQSIRRQQEEVCDTCGVPFSAFGINCDCHLKDIKEEN